MNRTLLRTALICAMTAVCVIFACGASLATAYLDSQVIYSNQDPNTETRRSDHFRICFGHYNRDGAGLSETMVQGNLQMFEHMWDRWVTEMGMHDINESVTNPDGNKYRTNFNVLMTWNDGGGGGAWSSMDGGGYFYAMANPGYCRWDPPSGATPHEMGHAWEGSAAGFNGSDSSGAWWECTANWMQLQFLNGYPQAGGYIANGMYYPCHGRDYYDSWMIWEAARDDARFGPEWVNRVWTDFTPDQQAHEYIVDRMLRVDNNTGEADRSGAVKDLWGDMVKKMVTWDYDRHQWLVTANSADDGSDWGFYQRCRTPMVKIAGTNSYRPERSHIPMEYGFDIIPLTATAGTTVSCNFQPQCDPVRQSDWRACFVAVTSKGDARYSSLWNLGTNSIALANDESKLYLVVIAVPKPMKIGAWNSYLTDAGLQFPFAVSFTNAAPKNVVWPTPTGVTWKTFTNADGTKCTHVQNSATVDSTCYLSPNAMVLNAAQVKGYARIEDYAVVRNSAQVRDYAVVSGHAVVQDNAQVYGNAKVRDWARVFGYAEVYDNAKVIEHANCGDGNATTHNTVFGSAVVKGTTYVYDTSTFQGCLIVDGDSANGNGAAGSNSYVAADHGVHFGWQWGQNTSIFSQLPDNGYVYAQHDFERDNAVFAMDKYGINHGFLINGCKAGVDADRGGLVLPLDGVSQYVELHNSVNDFRETAYTIWVKWTGSASDQRIWSMGDGASKQMYLTPKDGTTGNLRFAISNGTTTQYLNGTAPLGTGWTHIAVTFGSPVFNTTTKTWSATGTLYVNGTQVATSTGMITPDAVNAALMENADYIGRGNAGNYFAGCVDDFRAYMKTLTSSDISSLYISTQTVSPITPTTDTTAPTPDAATWLAPPAGTADNAITMSATPGTDDSGWVEYYFDCTSGGGHDSGWISFNRYTDVGLTPGTACTYTVKMRDRAGNETAPSAPASAAALVSSMAGITASFAYGPVGIADGQITMRANKLTSPSGTVLYKFDRLSPSIATSGWQASPTYTDTSLTIGTSYSYRVTAKDGRGNLSVGSATLATLAKDVAAPILPIPVAHWTTQPYSTVDNKLCMTAGDVTDSTGVEYFFHCVSGDGPDSIWQDSATFTTGIIPDGTYVYEYKVRDKSGQHNESAYSMPASGTVSPYRGYHSFTLADLASLPDDYLVSFNGTVVRIDANNYLIKDLATGISITVKPNAGRSNGSNNEATDVSLGFKSVNVKGHLYTLNGIRLVTYATVTPTGFGSGNSVSGRVTSTTGTGIAGATVYFSETPNASVTPMATITTDANGNYSLPTPDGNWYVCAGSSAYNTSADQLVTMNGANIANINFSLVINSVISGKVTSKTDGTAISGASVYFSKSAGAAAAPAFTATTDASGNYSQPVQNGTWYVSASKPSYFMSADKTAAVSGADVSGINFALNPNTRNIPRTGDLWFSAITDTFPLSGSTGDWASYLPAGQTLTMTGSPTVSLVRGLKWAHSVYNDYDGFRQGTYASPVAVNGASIIIALKPTRNTIGTSWTSAVDIFYNRLCLGIRNNTGLVNVAINGNWTSAAAGTEILDGQSVVLSLVVQPDGTYKVWENGIQIMDVTTVRDMTSLNPSSGNTIYVGHGVDGWSSFNGEVGDVFVYKVALTDAERKQLETDIGNKFDISTAVYTITASAGAGGAISPSGSLSTPADSNRTFNITPEIGFGVDDVLVDGVSVGAVTSYTFTGVSADHTIAASFHALTPYTITASAAAGGTITPSGAVTVYSTTSQTFTIAPNAGFGVADVLVDGVSVGAVTSYTFNNVAGNHTISATFMQTVFTITASSTSNGSISPLGAVSVNRGTSKTFTITPNQGNSIANVTVDGVSQGPISSYTFSNVTADHTITARFTSGNIPRTADILFACSADDLPASGAITSWLTMYPTDGSLTPIGTPVVETINGKVWEQNLYADGDGFQFGSAYTSPIAVNGASIVAVVKPLRNATATSWTSAVDIFQDRLVLGVRGDQGWVTVRRNGSNDLSSIAIPNGQATILSLIVQLDGTYKVYANGVQIMDKATNGAFTSLTPGAAATAKCINVGRSGNTSYAWTTFNGNIGDVYVYKIALSDSDRYQLESGVAGRYGISLPNPATNVANIAALKSQAAGTLVNLTGTATVVYAPKNASGARTTTFFYIAEKQGIAGLKVVDKISDTLSIGNQVTNLTGYVRTAADGKPYLELTADPAGSGNTPIPALGINNRIVFSEPKIFGQAIKIWGRVKSISGSTFAISDGGGFDITVNVNGVALPSPFDTTKTVIVTGILGDGAIQAQEVVAGQ